MSASPPTARPTVMRRLLTALGPGLAALRTYWKPFVLIQFAALAIVAAYFTVPPFARFCEVLAALNKRGGIPSSALVCAVAAGILPEFAKTLTGRPRPPFPRWWRDVAFNVAFFAFSGVTVFALYALQGYLFGDKPSVATTLKKVAFDQFCFTVLWSAPFGLTVYALRRHHFNIVRAWPEINPARMVVKTPSLLLPNWAFWIPMTSMVYSLPGALQFPLFACAMAAWALLMVFIATGDAAPADARGRPGR